MKKPYVKPNYTIKVLTPEDREEIIAEILKLPTLEAMRSLSDEELWRIFARGQNLADRMRAKG